MDVWCDRECQCFVTVSGVARMVQRISNLLLCVYLAPVVQWTYLLVTLDSGLAACLGSSLWIWQHALPSMAMFLDAVTPRLWGLPQRMLWLRWSSTQQVLFFCSLDPMGTDPRGPDGPNGPETLDISRLISDSLDSPVTPMYQYIHIDTIHTIMSMYMSMYMSMSMYMYICIYVYMYTCIYVYMYICIYVYMYICIYVYVYIYMYMYMNYIYYIQYIHIISHFS